MYLCSNTMADLRPLQPVAELELVAAVVLTEELVVPFYPLKNEHAGRGCDRRS